MRQILDKLQKVHEEETFEPTHQLFSVWRNFLNMASFGSREGSRRNAAHSAASFIKVYDSYEPRMRQIVNELQKTDLDTELSSAPPAPPSSAQETVEPTHHFFSVWRNFLNMASFGSREGSRRNAAHSAASFIKMYDSYEPRMGQIVNELQKMKTKLQQLEENTDGDEGPAAPPTGR
ncbi:unnamed protein product [Pleuronectes platessa]|uniref:Uncharacterized protein n=1 Tax=Pleuronectes platessa TaxID=8262 RepID=A0A9N7YF23_PLEPL|nr:unnamed protein product [Pleuronectes platessa]